MNNQHHALTKLAKYCETELFEEAKTLYDYNNSKGFPVMVYEVILDYEVTYQNHAIVSLYTDEYIFSGRSPWKHNTRGAKLEFAKWKADSTKRLISKQSIFYD